MSFIRNILDRQDIDDFDYAKQQQTAKQWMQSRIQTLNTFTIGKTTQLRQTNILAEGRQKNTFELGRMYLFRYAPITRNKLPYYDTFPLMIPYYRKGSTIFGANFHYININMRRRLFENMVDLNYITDGTETDEPKFNFTYRRLKGKNLFRFLPPTIHQYKLGRVRSILIEIDAREWPLALYLPVEAFKKTKKSVVWDNSLEQIKNV